MKGVHMNKLKMNNRLKAKIIEKFGTQADFAQMAETSEPEVSRIVRGRRNLNTEKKTKWAQLLSTPVSEIF